MSTSNKTDQNEETSINEEIEENLSISEHISIGTLSENPLSVTNENLNKINKKRHLFDIDNDTDDNDDFDGGNIAATFKFDDSNLDALLSGDNIAQHFIVTEKSESESHEKKLLSHNSNDDSLDAALNEFGSPVHPDKISPLELPDKTCEDEDAKNLQSISAEQTSINMKTPSNSSKTKDNPHKVGKEKTSEDAVSLDKLSSKKMISVIKEISPFKDDVILINNEKISLKSLKIKQNDENSDEFTLTTNQNTTNDVSDICIDECSSYPIGHMNVLAKSLDDNGEKKENVHNRNCKSLDEDKVKLAQFIGSTVEPTNIEEKLNDSIEEDHSIEELIISNASIEQNQKDSLDLDKQDLVEINSDNDINNESQMKQILNETILNKLPDKLFVTAEPTDSLESNISIEDLKGKILLNAGLTEITKSKLVRNYSLERSDGDCDKDDFAYDDDSTAADLTNIPIKSMEHVDDLREALDDITEESDVSEPKVYSVVAKNADLLLETNNQQREMGQAIRKIIDANIQTNEDDVINTMTDKFVIDEMAHNSFDSVVSLNMLEQMEYKVKELQDIVQGKDLCLAALNMQLESFSRRDSLRELPPSGRDSCSLATSSTEYRTYQDDYVTKVKLNN